MIRGGDLSITEGALVLPQAGKGRRSAAAEERYQAELDGFYTAIREIASRLEFKLLWWRSRSGFRVCMTCCPDPWRRFKAMCALMNVWPSDVLEEMIEQWLKRNEQKAQTQGEEEP
jgi:hypothetical protein